MAIGGGSSNTGADGIDCFETIDGIGAGSGGVSLTDNIVTSTIDAVDDNLDPSI